MDSFVYDITPMASAVLIDREFFNNSNWHTTSSISGTASDSVSGISVLEIAIQNSGDDSWWDGTNWFPSETWLIPYGLGTWSYSFNNNNLTDGVAYTVFSRGTDAAGNIQPDPGLDIFSYDITAPTAGVVQDLSLIHI